jgi:hypothetical protein
VQKSLERHVSRLATLENPPLNIRRQEREPADLALIGAWRRLHGTAIRDGTVTLRPAETGHDPVGLLQLSDQHRIAAHALRGLTSAPDPASTAAQLAADREGDNSYGRVQRIRLGVGDSVSRRLGAKDADPDRPRFQVDALQTGDYVGQARAFPSAEAI